MVLRYRPELEPALNSLTVTFNGRERVAVVGRTGTRATPPLARRGCVVQCRVPRRVQTELTHAPYHPHSTWVVAVATVPGAGKSTIAAALFRLVEIDSGSIVVDGVDLSTLGLEDVRGRHRALAIIPQDPWLASGTILDNLCV